VSVAGSAFLLSALELRASLSCDLEPRRDLGEDRGPVTRYGASLTRPRPRPVGGPRSMLAACREQPLLVLLAGVSTPRRRHRDAKAFGLVDTLGLLVAVVVVAANVSDNAGGIAAVEFDSR